MDALRTLRFRIQCVSWVFFVALLTMSSVALSQEMDNTSCGETGTTLKNWLSVICISMSLHIVNTAARNVSRPCTAGGTEGLFPIVLHGLREINFAMMLVWFTLGNLWVFRATDCAKGMPFIFGSSVCLVVVADVRALLPCLARICVLTCPTCSLAFLRHVFGAAGLLLERLDAESGLVGDRHAMDSDAPPDDGEIAQWICWLDDRGCSVMDYRDVVQVKDRDWDTEEVTGTGDEDGGKVLLAGTATGAATGAGAGGIQEDEEKGEQKPIKRRGPPPKATNVLDDKGALRSNITIAAGFEKAGCTLTQCVICIGEFADEKEGDAAREAAGEATEAGAGPEHSSSSGARVAGEVEMECPSAQSGAAPRDTSSDDVFVVPFPCAARHIFHEACLHGWLVTCARSRREPRCPLCREGPEEDDEALDIRQALALREGRVERGRDDRGRVLVPVPVLEDNRV
jgi:hypothetical protein